MGQSIPLQTRRLESFEQLNEAVRGAQREVVQLGLGRVHGYLTHLSIDGLPVDFGEFSVGMQSRGLLSGDRITIGMLTGCSDRVMQWSGEMHPGDVMVTPPGGDHEGRYYGGASFAVISLTLADIHSFFGSEPRMREVNSWQKNLFRAGFNSRDRVLPRLRKLLARLQNRNTTLTADAAEFWRRSIIEAMTAAVLLNDPADSGGPLPSALKIVRKVEDYLDRAGMSPVHISEICGRLNISRRTLHRAFQDALGIGPVTFLQRRRLCSIHSILRNSDPATTTIAEVALQHGFVNLGRFSGYYRGLFEEYPSQTFAKSRQAAAMPRERGPAARPRA